LQINPLCPPFEKGGNKKGGFVAAPACRRARRQHIVRQGAIALQMQSKLCDYKQNVVSPACR